MQDSRDRITSQTATELFTLAAQIQGQKSHDYAPSELVQAATEAGISPENLQEALQIMRIQQTQNQTRRRNLRLILSSGVAGIAIAFAGVCTYFAFNQQSAMGGRGLPAAAMVNPDSRVAIELIVSTTVTVTALSTLMFRLFFLQEKIEIVL
jgi:hypothetical protein